VHFITKLLPVERECQTLPIQITSQSELSKQASAGSAGISITSSSALIEPPLIVHISAPFLPLVMPALPHLANEVERHLDAATCTNG